MEAKEAESVFANCIVRVLFVCLCVCVFLLLFDVCAAHFLHNRVFPLLRPSLSGVSSTFAASSVFQSCAMRLFPCFEYLCGVFVQKRAPAMYFVHASF